MQRKRGKEENGARLAGASISIAAGAVQPLKCNDPLILINCAQLVGGGIFATVFRRSDTPARGFIHHTHELPAPGAEGQPFRVFWNIRLRLGKKSFSVIAIILFCEVL